MRVDRMSRAWNQWARQTGAIGEQAREAKKK